MSVFFDTSVFIAAFQTQHERHEACHRLFVHTREPVCAQHTLAEFYATTTGFPHRARLAPEEAMLLMEQIVERCRIVSLSVQEYVDTIRALSANHRIGGATYDGLLLACARKAEVSTIYTLNLRHFHALAPDLADRIVTP